MIDNTNIPRNNREWFLYYLFTDLDFVDEKDKICAEIKSLAGVDSYGLMMLIQKDSLCDQLERLGKEGSMVAEQIRALTKRFDVSIATIEQGIRYINKLHGISRTFRSMPSVGIDGNEVIVRLSGNMKLEDIKAVYPYIQKLQKQLPDYKNRNRSKDRPDLIYAVHKQRLNGLKFKEINYLYENGNLPGYAGSHPIIGEDSLEKDYRRYRHK